MLLRFDLRVPFSLPGDHSIKLILTHGLPDHGQIVGILLQCGAFLFEIIPIPFCTAESEFQLVQLFLQIQHDPVETQELIPELGNHRQDLLLSVALGAFHRPGLRDEVFKIADVSPGKLNCVLHHRNRIIQLILCLLGLALDPGKFFFLLILFYL